MDKLFDIYEDYTPIPIYGENERIRGYENDIIRNIDLYNGIDMDDMVGGTSDSEYLTPVDGDGNKMNAFIDDNYLTYNTIKNFDETEYNVGGDDDSIDDLPGVKDMTYDDTSRDLFTLPPPEQIRSNQDDSSINIDLNLFDDEFFHIEDDVVSKGGNETVSPTDIKSYIKNLLNH